MYMYSSSTALCWSVVTFASSTCRCLAGVIRTNAVLDRESKEFYWLSVVACDRAVVPRCSVAEVSVRVDDVNDNKPRTPLPVYYPEVKENSEDHVTVLQLQVSQCQIPY